MSLRDTQVNKTWSWASIVGQGLRFCASTSEGRGSIPGERTKIPHAAAAKKKNTKPHGPVTALCYETFKRQYAVKCITSCHSVGSTEKCFVISVNFCGVSISPMADFKPPVGPTERGIGKTCTQVALERQYQLAPYVPRACHLFVWASWEGVLSK